MVPSPPRSRSTAPHHSRPTTHAARHLTTPAPPNANDADQQPPRGPFLPYFGSYVDKHLSALRRVLEESWRLGGIT
ncbi:hypothetical protein [Nonomuraea guangzhouensis]|uniref:Uncharacterized protein n=1 Tax=Nonomuraea guangzhouensis TaxID=1291555 RepID=A0ABW4GG01_9ACTN|nr:hypothetical protein [Nonomuraea guangzhouensis]